MPAYEYKALDARGKQKQGVLEADAPRAVRQQLREKGLTPLAVEAAVEKHARSNHQAADSQHADCYPRQGDGRLHTGGQLR